MLSILVLSFMVIYHDSYPTRNNASYTYPPFKYKSNEERLHHIVSDASSVVGTQEWMRMKEAEFEARKIHVQEVCAELSSKDRWISTDQGRHFWFDIRHGFAVCAHPKAGSSSWRRILLMLSNLPPEFKNKTIVNGNLWNIANKYLRLDEQEQSAFNVDNFLKRHGLIKFAFC